MIKLKLLAGPMLLLGAVLFGLDLTGHIAEILSIRTGFAAGLTLAVCTEFSLRVIQGAVNGFRKGSGKGGKVEKAIDLMRLYVLDRLAMYSLMGMVLLATTAAQGMLKDTILTRPSTIMQTLAVAAVFFWLCVDSYFWLSDIWGRRDNMGKASFLSQLYYVGKKISEGDVTDAAQRVEEFGESRTEEDVTQPSKKTTPDA